MCYHRCNFEMLQHLAFQLLTNGLPFIFKLFLIKKNTILLYQCYLTYFFIVKLFVETNKKENIEIRMIVKFSFLEIVCTTVSQFYARWAGSLNLVCKKSFTAEPSGLVLRINSSTTSNSIFQAVKALLFSFFLAFFSEYIAVDSQCPKELVTPREITPTWNGR